MYGCDSEPTPIGQKIRDIYYLEMALTTRDIKYFSRTQIVFGNYSGI